MSARGCPFPVLADHTLDSELTAELLNSSSAPLDGTLLDTALLEVLLAVGQGALSIRVVLEIGITLHDLGLNVSAWVGGNQGGSGHQAKQSIAKVHHFDGLTLLNVRRENECEADSNEPAADTSNRSLNNTYTL